MPIILNDGSTLRSLNYDSIQNDSTIQENNKEFLSNSIESFKSEIGLLYVSQREMAAVESNDPVINTIGSDDSTTCHIMLLVDMENDNCSLCHFDGSDNRDAIYLMIHALKRLKYKNDYDKHKDKVNEYKLYLIGGFLDDRNLSQEISNDLIDIMNSMSEKFYLKLCLITKLNDKIVNEQIHFPLVYGLGYNLTSKKVFMCNNFMFKGPDQKVRSARHFSHNGTINIYNCEKHQLEIGPFNYKPISYVKEYLKLPDSYLLKYFSTSPEQEPPHFIQNLRNSFEIMIQHPKPLQTYFKNEKPKIYKKNPDDGNWILIQEK